MHKINSWAKREARGLPFVPFSRARAARKAEAQDAEARSALREEPSRPTSQMESTVQTPRGSDEPALDRDAIQEGQNGRSASPPANANINEKYEQQQQQQQQQHNPNVTSRTSTTEGAGRIKKKKTIKTTNRSILGQLRNALFNSWINVLLVAAPVGIAIHFAHVDPIAVFMVNFIAIIPLAGLLSYATEEIAIRVGETLGGLLNASFGNAVELIVSIIALTKRDVVVVQTSLIGSILSNLLLVLGMCFLVGGFNRFEQFFNMTVAQTASSLLTLAVMCLVIPTAFEWAAPENFREKKDDIVQLSRGTAVIMLLVYGSYLFFQLKTHAALFSEKSADATVRPGHETPPMSSGRALAHMGGATGAVGGKIEAHNHKEEDEEEEEEEAELTPVTALILLAISTVLVALCAEFLVDSISEVVERTGISRYFVGLILLPIVGNAAEHATAVTVAYKDKMDLAIGVAVGSSMQIALLVIPFIVVLGWIMHIDEMTLYFDGFQVVILFASVLLVNYLIADGKSNFLEGNLLLSMYIIIAVAAWYYPNVHKEGGVSTGKGSE